VLVIGRKGSGKSVACRYLAAHVRGQLVVLNVKNDPGLSKHLRDRYNAHQVTRGSVAGLVAALRQYRVVEYVFSDALDMDEADKVYRVLANRRDLTVWLDECYGPTTSATVARGLAQYLQHGRFKNLRHMGATQRPRHIAKPLLTEADHILFFPLGFAAEDWDTVAANMALRPRELETIVASILRDRGALGEYAQLWYDRTKNVLHRRPGVPGVA
jgi:hypothetical protein